MSNISRKLTGLIAAALLSSAQAFVPVHAEELVFVSWGGAYQDAIRSAWIEPFSADTGIEIIEDTSPEIAKIKAMVETDSVSWDIVTAGGAGLADGIKQGLFEEITDDMVNQSHVLADARNPYGVPSEIFSTVMAFSTKAFPDSGPQPQNWADFWDVEKFPGKRAYRGKVAGALEPALMADGVAPEQVYEVLATKAGMQRAIDKIKELKPHIEVWWKSGAQHAQLMKDGEVDMTTGWNGRFDNAKKDGAKVAYSFNQALLDYDCFAIPKGAPNKDVAMEFLNEISKPEYQDDLPKYITYGPTNKAAYETGEITAEQEAGLPSSPANAAMQLPVSLEWYAKWETIAAEMYQEMLTE